MAADHQLKPKFEGKRLPWEILVPAATVLLYASSYLFQFGYNSTYGIPSALISLDAAKIAGSLIPVGMLLIFNVIASELIYGVAGYNANKLADRDRATATLLCANLALLVGLIVFKLVQNPFLQFLYDTCLFTILIALSRAIRRFRSRKSGVEKRPTTETVKKYVSYLGLYLPYAKEIVTGSLFLILAGLIMFLLGSLWANFQSNYLVEANNPQLVVLNTYGSGFVIGKVNTAGILSDHYDITDSTANPQFAVKRFIAIDKTNTVARDQTELKTVRRLVDNLRRDSSNTIYRKKSLYVLRLCLQVPLYV